MSGDWYDKNGDPIDMKDFGPLKKDQSYSRIGVTKIGPYMVSTVWLGLDHNFQGGPPLIFETMVFPESEEFDTVRYSTEEQAKQGHEEMAALVRQHFDRYGL